MWRKVTLAPYSQLRWTYWVLGDREAFFMFALHSVIGNSCFRLNQTGRIPVSITPVGAIGSLPLLKPH